LSEDFKFDAIYYRQNYVQRTLQNCLRPIKLICKKNIFKTAQNSNISCRSSINHSQRMIHTCFFIMRPFEWEAALWILPVRPFVCFMQDSNSKRLVYSQAC